MTSRVIERLVGLRGSVRNAGVVDMPPEASAPVRTEWSRPARRATAGSEIPPQATAELGSSPTPQRAPADQREREIPHDLTPATARCDDVAASSAESAVEFVAALLRRSAPRLLTGGGPGAAERFAGLAVRRMAREVDAAITSITGEVGRAAATLAPADRHALQDAVLVAKVDRERAIAEAIAAIGIGGLLAFVHDAAAARGADSIDALRCRHLVFGGAEPVAREAALDLATDRTDDRRSVRIRGAVLPVFRAAIAGDRLPQAALRCLDLALDGSIDGSDPQLSAPPHPVRCAIVAGRRGDEGQFAQALAAGDADAAATVLAHAAGCSPLAIRRAMHGRDAEALVSLVWRADFPADLAAPAQIVLGRIPPGLALRGGAADEFPLAVSAMASLARDLAG